jgi:hypothetical protein
LIFSTISSFFSTCGLLIFRYWSCRRCPFSRLFRLFVFRRSQLSQGFPAPFPVPHLLLPRRQMMLPLDQHPLQLPRLLLHQQQLLLPLLFHPHQLLPPLLLPLLHLHHLQLLLLLLPRQSNLMEPPRQLLLR